jgi:hypothetical protein
VCRCVFSFPPPPPPLGKCAENIHIIYEIYKVSKYISHLSPLTYHHQPASTKRSRLDFPCFPDGKPLPQHRPLLPTSNRSNMLISSTAVLPSLEIDCFAALPGLFVRSNPPWHELSLPIVSPVSAAWSTNAWMWRSFEAWDLLQMLLSDEFFLDAMILPSLRAALQTTETKSPVEK